MDRPYRAALSNDEAFDLMREGSGRHFDPAVLDTFFANFDGISAIQNETH
jgi:putative two-component system response regulator